MAVTVRPLGAGPAVFLSMKWVYCLYLYGTVGRNSEVACMKHSARSVTHWTGGSEEEKPLRRGYSIFFKRTKLENHELGSDYSIYRG